MDLSTSAVLFLFFIYNLCEAGNREYNSIIEVGNGGEWGEWGEIEICSKGYANAFSLKVAPQQGLGDDTSLNGIRLHCSSGEVVQSSVGPFGEWQSIVACPRGYLLSFGLMVEESQMAGDDTAANNIQFNCGDGTRLKGNGVEFGTYGQWSSPCRKGAICGIQTKVEPKVKIDNTALNDVHFFCCD